MQRAWFLARHLAWVTGGRYSVAEKHPHQAFDDCSRIEGWQVGTRRQDERDGEDSQNRSRHHQAARPLILECHSLIHASNLRPAPRADIGDSANGGGQPANGVRHPAISDDGLELFFTRMVNGEPGVYRSNRAATSAPWGSPSPLAAITGFAEAPALGPGGNVLYYHARRGNRFVIERVTRPAPARRRAVIRR